jgi:predicted MFS family arabinose efflux permease
MIGHLITYARSRSSRTIGMVFAAQGVLFGTWAAMIPLIKQKFGLDEAELGLLLLSLQGGVLIMNPFSVGVLRRLGAPAAALICLALTAGFFTLPMLAPDIVSLGITLFFAGAGFATVNVAINTCASMLEIRDQIRIMSTSHGLWSAGAMAGSALTSLATGLGVGAVGWSAGMALLILVLSWLLKSDLLPLDNRQKQERKAQGGQKFAWPSSALWTIILLSLCTNITEGTMADWSAVFLREVVHSEEYAVGWGFSAYAFCMAAGRFFGDGLISNFGAAKMLRIGGAVAALGLLLLSFIPVMPFALLWFALVGAGVSLGAPILYAAAAKVPGMAQGAGLATMNTFAMVGFFGGPVLIGFIAKAWNLPVAFALIGLAAVWWAWKAVKVEQY